MALVTLRFCDYDDDEEAVTTVRLVFDNANGSRQTVLRDLCAEHVREEKTRGRKPPKGRPRKTTETSE